MTPYTFSTLFIETPALKVGAVHVYLHLRKTPALSARVACRVPQLCHRFVPSRDGIQIFDDE